MTAFNEDGTYNTLRRVPEIKNSFRCTYVADVDGDGVPMPGEERWFFEWTETELVDGMAREREPVKEEFSSQEALNARVIEYLTS